jgi:hypothetical protein
MNPEPILTLHCPKCADLVEVVLEGTNLVCLECGWKFDERIAARVLGGPLTAPAATQPPAGSAAQ